MANVRIGVIGLGNIGMHHAGYLSDGKVSRATLAAACTSSPEKAAAFTTARIFQNPADLFQSGCIDAVLIATPHAQHVPLGVEALERGLHILIEKPIARHKAEAATLIETAAAHPALTFGAMFQFRVEPRYLAIRRILREHGLGRLLRLTWIMTDWFRTEAYYSSSPWRATWSEEGGGVLINQCLHNLDMLQWLVGMPRSVRGFCSLGRHHDLEVEDEATAVLSYADGLTATLITSTGESPGANRLEIAGTGGVLLLENNRLLYTKNAVASDEFSRKADRGFGRPESVTTEIPIPSHPSAHAAVTQNFVNAILNNEPLLAPGAEGLPSIELANGILYSSLQQRSVELPLDEAAYAKKLQELAARSTRLRRVTGKTRENITESFRR